MLRWLVVGIGLMIVIFRFTIRAHLVRIDSRYLILRFRLCFFSMKAESYELQDKW